MLERRLQPFNGELRFARKVELPLFSEWANVSSQECRRALLLTLLVTFTLFFSKEVFDLPRYPNRPRDGRTSLPRSSPSPAQLSLAGGAQGFSRTRRIPPPWTHVTTPTLWSDIAWLSRRPPLGSG